MTYVLCRAMKFAYRKKLFLDPESPGDTSFLFPQMTSTADAANMKRLIKRRERSSFRGGAGGARNCALGFKEN